MNPPKPSSIESLCARLGNENAHTEHVAALAVRLFDATRAALGIPAGHRRWLLAAARLHDVAYRLDPQHHLTASAELVAREGVAGYRPAEWPILAGVMLCHGGALAAVQNELLGLGLTESRLATVRRLGAFLRIADGLDYGHLQDARIVRVRVAKRRVRVTVASPLFPPNLVRASRKADLWRQQFDREIVFEEAPGTASLLTPTLTVPEAARRLFSLHTKRLLVHVDGAVAGTDPEALRQVRVAIRRLRLLRRIFRKHLPAELAETFDKALAQLGNELGRARDLDVWLQWLETEAARQPWTRSRLWEPFLAHQRRRRELETLTVRRCLRGAHFAALRNKLAWLTRAELPAAPGKPGRLLPLAVKRWHRALRRVQKRAKLRHATSSEKLHELRTTMRRARYVGEFFHELLEPRDRKFIRHLRAAEKRLGRVHDIHVALEQHVPVGPPPPRALVRHLRQEQIRELERWEKAWDRLEWPR
jgi:CHAD domain-containing protein